MNVVAGKEVRRLPGDQNPRAGRPEIRPKREIVGNGSRRANQLAVNQPFIFSASINPPFISAAFHILQLPWICYNIQAQGVKGCPGSRPLFGRNSFLVGIRFLFLLDRMCSKGTSDCDPDPLSFILTDVMLRSLVGTKAYDRSARELSQ